MKRPSSADLRFSADRIQENTAPARKSPKITGIVNFGTGSERQADDYDVLIGYQIFLGRNPENSFVIHEEKKNQTIKRGGAGFLISQEFYDLVAQPLALGVSLVHSTLGTVLTSEHITGHDKREAGCAANFGTNTSGAGGLTE